MELQMALNSLYSWGWFQTLLSLLFLPPKCWEYRHVSLQKDLVKKKTVTSLKKKKRWETASRLGCDICNWVLIWLHGRRKVAILSPKTTMGFPVSAEILVITSFCMFLPSLCPWGDIEPEEFGTAYLSWDVCQGQVSSLSQPSLWIQLHPSFSKNSFLKHH